MGSGYVVDASVVIKLLVEEVRSQQAHEMFDRMADDPAVRLYAPELLLTECANILWKHTFRFGMKPSQAESKLREILSLDLYTLPILDHLPDALSLAVSHGISVYDACYVAVARYVKAPLVTADEKLVAKVPSATARLISLATWQTDTS